jgi:hypothetical protein
MESLKYSASQAESAKTSATTAEIPKSRPVEFTFREEVTLSGPESLVTRVSPSRTLIIANTDI